MRLPDKIPGLKRGVPSPEDVGGTSSRHLPPEHHPSKEESITASASFDDDLRAALAEVAEQHADEATGYGETAYDPETRTVLYVCGDWTDPEPIEADFLAIDGVDGFEHEAEALPLGWWDAEVVYPENPPSWVLNPPDDGAALADLVRFAAEPIAIDPEPAEPEVAEEPAAPVVAAATVEPNETLALAHRAIDALTEFARRPADPAPTVNLHLPTHALSVAVERQTPDVHVDATTTIEEGAFSIASPEQPVQVDVHVPEQPAPVVEITNEMAAAEVNVTVEAPKPTVAVPIRNDDGEIVRVEHHPAE